MKVLVACEFSGIVRDAFIRRGHDAWSLDLLPSEGEFRNRHIQGDIAIVPWGCDWDLLIGHPPCQFLTNAGARWLYKSGRGTEPDPERWANMRQARQFFLRLYNAGVPRVCIENPIPHRHANLPPYSQVIQPWQFGHGETKATCLWLRGLPPLKPTDIVEGRKPRVHHVSPGPGRWKERSRTLPGIAAAMAEQWGSL